MFLWHGYLNFLALVMLLSYNAFPNVCLCFLSGGKKTAKQSGSNTFRVLILQLLKEKLCVSSAFSPHSWITLIWKHAHVTQHRLQTERFRKCELFNQMILLSTQKMKFRGETARQSRLCSFIIFVLFYFSLTKGYFKNHLNREDGITNELLWDLKKIDLFWKLLSVGKWFTCKLCQIP